MAETVLVFEFFICTITSVSIHTHRNGLATRFQVSGFISKCEQCLAMDMLWPTNRQALGIACMRVVICFFFFFFSVLQISNEKE